MNIVGLQNKGRGEITGDSETSNTRAPEQNIASE